MRAIVILLLFLCQYCVAQPPKNVTTIIVKNVDYKKVANALLDKGYFIDRGDSELGTIITKERRLSNMAAHILIHARIIDSTAHITGEIKSMFTLFDTPPTYHKILNKGMKGSDMKMAFNEMNEIGLLLSKNPEYK